MGLIHQVNQSLTKRYTLPRRRQKPLKGTAFSQRISQLRKKEGMTMTAISERIGVTPSYVSLLEAGDRQPSREIVLKLAGVFFPPNDIDSLDELLVLAGLSPTRYEMQLQPQDTQAIYEELLLQQPEDFKTFTALIRLLIRRHELEAAEERIYDGMKRFQNAWQLQALMAHLQLCLKGYESAVTFLEGALDLYRKRHAEQDLSHDADLADLYVNLGVIYFIWGMDSVGSSAKAGSKPGGKQRKLALERFRLACERIEQALVMTPGDIYLLDEYARISFNIADLSEGRERQAAWKAAIERFFAVICAENVGALGQASVRETNAFLAHAHSRAGLFDEARRLIGVIQSCHPDFWLIYYVKACHYSLRAEAEKKDALLDESLSALRQAIASYHPQNASLDYAREDEDLEALRQGRAKAVTSLLKDFREATAPTA